LAIPDLMSNWTAGSAKVLIAACLLVSAGCASIGPISVSRDRFDYNGEVARSWKEQMLLNIVKTRYLDVPVFLDISQIVAGYTLQGGVALGGSTGDPLGEGLSVTATGNYSDRPTITYSPLTGAEFNRNMLTPIPPSEVLFTMMSGWPADLVFRLTVRSINGIDSTGPSAARYDRVVKIIREMQKGNLMGMRVKPGPQNTSTTLIVFPTRTLTPEQTAMRQELREILGVPQSNSEMSVVFGQASSRSGEIAMQTLSIMQMLIQQGTFVEVPDQDLREGRTKPGVQTKTIGLGEMHIKFSEAKPDDAFACIKYRNGWFRIDDRDLVSKTTFALLMLLSTLTETGTRESIPLVTIPAG
jgi:hypothetical protein